MLYGMAVCHQSFIARRSLANAYDTSYRCQCGYQLGDRGPEKNQPKTVHTHQVSVSTW